MFSLGGFLVREENIEDYTELFGNIERQGDKYMFVQRMKNLPLLETVSDKTGKIIRIRVAR